jgi:hypothetical protein
MIVMMNRFFQPNNCIINFKKIYKQSNSFDSNKIIYHPDSQQHSMKGMFYIPNFVTEEEEINILEKIDSNQWLKEIHRRQQHYGYVYYHSRSDLPEIQPTKQPSSILPLKTFDDMMSRLAKLYKVKLLIHPKK